MFFQPLIAFQGGQEILTFLELANLGGSGLIFALLTYLFRQSEERIVDRIKEIFLAYSENLNRGEEESSKEVARQLERQTEEIVRELKTIADRSVDRD